MTGTPEAFLLLTIPDVELTAPNHRERGLLELECVTVPAAPTARDVFLVLRLGRYETVVDPERQITVHNEPGVGGARTYTFHRTTSDPVEIVVTLTSGGKHNATDVETFDGVLEQYAVFTPDQAHVERTTTGDAYQVTDGKEDLRGRLVLIDQDNGEVLGTVGDKPVRADPMLFQPGHEHDPVVINVGPSGELDEAREIFVQGIPENEQNLMTRGASMMSSGIIGATNLVTRGMTMASNAYIAHATPHPSARPTRDGAPPPPPPRAVTWFTSDSTRNGLRTAHTYTGKAVKVSGKTIAMVEGLIARAVGGTPSTRPKKRQALADIPTPPPPPPRPIIDTTRATGDEKTGFGRSSSSQPSPWTPVSRGYASSPEPLSRPGSAPPPPAFADNKYPSARAFTSSPNASSTSLATLPPAPPPPPTYPGSAPALPPRRSGEEKMLSPPQMSSRSRSPSPGPSSGERQEGGSGKPSRLGAVSKAALSAHLLMATLDDSAKRLIEVGSDRLTAVVNHKYGSEAAHSTRILTGTARNVGLVYIDVTGLGRRALLKTAGKQWIKAKVKGKQMELRTDERGEVVQAQPLEK